MEKLNSNSALEAVKNNLMAAALKGASKLEGRLATALLGKVMDEWKRVHMLYFKVSKNLVSGVQCLPAPPLPCNKHTDPKERTTSLNLPPPRSQVLGAFMGRAKKGVFLRTWHAWVEFRDTRKWMRSFVLKRIVYGRLALAMSEWITRDKKEVRSLIIPLKFRWIASPTHPPSYDPTTLPPHPTVLPHCLTTPHPFSATRLSSTVSCKPSLLLLRTCFAMCFVRYRAAELNPRPHRPTISPHHHTTRCMVRLPHRCHQEQPGGGAPSAPSKVSVSTYDIHWVGRGNG